ncbi:MAG: enoyl-CoA hydratase/isomerase family protein [Planctomycetota bacterium]
MARIDIESKEHWDWLHLRLGKANAIGPTFLQRFDEALQSLPAAPDEGPARPLIVTGEGSVFSAGLELSLLIDHDRAQLEAFLSHFDRTFLSLATFPRPTIAAVNGHAIAGGAVLLLGFDLRLGASRLPSSTKAYWIGLKESALGIPLPRAGVLLLQRTIASLATQMDVALTGELFTPQQALERHLLDRLVPPQALEMEAEREAARFSQSTALAAKTLKHLLKHDLVAALEEPTDHTVFLDAWFAPETQRRIKEVVASLAR